MTGYYVIYNHASNSWYMSGRYWQMDRDYHTTNMPTKLKLDDWWTTDGDKQFILHQTDYQNVVCETNTKVNPHNIMRFATLKEAEDFLLSAQIIPTGGVDYYTIRKIYM